MPFPRLDAVFDVLRLRRAPRWVILHWQRIIMQLALCGVLAATIALAAVITYEKQQAMRVKLDVPRTFGRLRVALPLKWAISSGGGNGSEGADTAYAEEVLPAEQGRRLVISRQRLGLGISLASAQISPLQYMIGHRLISGVLDERELVDACNGNELTIEPITVAGWPGISIEKNTVILTPRGTIWRKELVACAILPGSQAVIVSISGSGTVEAADRKLLEEMCEAVSVVDLPPLPDPGGSVSLYDLALGLPPVAPGAQQAMDQSALVDSSATQPPPLVTVKVPRHYLLLPSDDPNRTGRDLLSDDDPWITAELIPCLFLPGAGASELRTMLLARDRDWAVGEIKSLPQTRAGLSRWQADMAGNSAFPSRAYLVSDDDGLALLAVFHGGFNASPDKFDAAWERLADSAQFLKSDDFDAAAQAGPPAQGSLGELSRAAIPHGVRAAVRRMLSAGTAESARLSDLGLAQLAPRTGYQGWSLWDESDNADKIEWMTMSWSTSGEGPHASWLGDRWTPLPGDELLEASADYSPGSAQRSHQNWSGSADQRLYSTTGNRESRPGGRGAWDAGQPRQHVTVEDGRLRVSIPPMKSSDSTALSATIGGNEIGVPSQFVPGGWLPLLLPRISADAGRLPLILRSESFVGCDALPLSSWLMLEIRNDPRTPAKLYEHGQPMGCVTVCVNGTGRLSRWYFTLSSDAKSSASAPTDAAPLIPGDDRAKALRYADFADGLRARQDPEKRIVELGDEPKPPAVPQP